MIELLGQIAGLGLILALVACGTALLLTLMRD